MRCRLAAVLSAAILMTVGLTALFSISVMMRDMTPAGAKVLQVLESVEVSRFLVFLPLSPLPLPLPCPLSTAPRRPTLATTSFPDVSVDAHGRIV